MPPHKVMAKTIWFLFIALCACMPAFAQNEDEHFRNNQLSSVRVADALKKYSDTAEREFRKKGMAWPPKDVYIRAFKSQNQMELWARNNETAAYSLIKTYPICAISGHLGPKRTKGDRQVPEGFYFIEEFNPHSEYYLSMLLNYPNYSDHMNGTAHHLGGDIYIHGGCVTIGCMPMTDDGIKELYTICLNAKMNGQEFIPVHIFPTRLNKSGMNYLKSEYRGDNIRLEFWASLKNSYDYFEKNHRLLPVMYTPDGLYAN